jgi:hypothetical protein
MVRSCVHNHYIATHKPKDTMQNAKQPTARQVLREMRAAGHVVRPAGFKVNGATAYRIAGCPGIHTVQGMALRFLAHA